VFLDRATGYAETRPFIEEGIATRLEGGTVSGGGIDDTDSLRALLAIRSPFDLSYGEGDDFFAWAIEERGIAAVLDAYVATSRARSDVEVEQALAERLGFGSLEDLVEAHVETRAIWYPELPATVTVFLTDELERGVVLDTSCSGPYAEGPAQWPVYQIDPESEVQTEARLEIPAPGIYEVIHDPLDFNRFPGQPWLQPTAPQFEETALSDLHPLNCSTWDLNQLRFGLPGEYGFRVYHSLSESISATLQITPNPSGCDF
jgi:hypothetical protein